MKGNDSRSLEQVLLHLIRSRLFIPLLVVCFIAVGLAGFLSERNLEEQQNQMASNQARMVDQYLDRAGRILDAVSRVATVSTPENTKIFMNGTWEGYGFFDTLYYLDDQGKILQLVPDDPRYQGLFMTALPSFDPVNTSMKPIISRPFISFRTGNPTVYLIHPLSSSKGTIVGELSLASLQQEITLAMGKQKRDFVFILDQSGKLIAHPQSDLVRQQVNQGDLVVFQQGLARDSTMIYPYEGIWVLGSAVRVDQAGWVVIDQIPLSVAFAPYALTLGLILVIALILWLTLMWTLRRELNHSIIKPLVTLSQGISSLAMGDYLLERNLVSHQYTFSELKNLAEDFQNMSRAVQTRQVALQKSEEELITYRDHLEELVKERTRELAIAKEQAEAANRAKSFFLSSMSHELRTPLNAILGYTQILKRSDLSKDVLTGLDIMEKSGQHLLTLITDILDLAKIEAGKMEILPASFSLPVFLDTINSIIITRAHEKNISFSFIVSGDIPPMITADETRLRQILLNILGNAVKYTDEGGVTFIVERRGMVRSSHPSGPDLHARLLFKVEDTGIGIASDMRDHLFRHFEQVGDPVHRKGGTGLGLAISQQLLHLMGSELLFESEICRGSAFWFELTLPAGNQVTDSNVYHGKDIIGYHGNRYRILVVDDIASNRMVIVDLLTPLGFEVIEAKNGREGIELIATVRPDLVLMDLFMPEMDGFASIRVIQDTFGRDLLPVIAISASVAGDIQKQAIEAGFNGFLNKPIVLSLLLEILGRYLNITWIYQRREPEIDFLTGPVRVEEMTPPPGDILEHLSVSARSGDIAAIIEEAGQIGMMGDEYHSFSDAMVKLAEGFELKKIRSLLAWFLENGEKRS